MAEAIKAWPEDWDVDWLKHDSADPERSLVKAAALLTAEAERLQRLKLKEGPKAMIAAKEAADALNGQHYRDEGSRDFFKALADSRLVAVYGASDDIMVLNGAIHDELYGIVAVSPESQIVMVNDAWEVPDDMSLNDLKAKSGVIEPLWCEEDDISWTYKTDIPHETFEIMDDDSVYCRGIVFSLDALKA